MTPAAGLSTPRHDTATIRQSFRDYQALVIGQGGAVLLATVNSVVMTRWLGSSGYGRLALFVMVTQVIFTTLAGWLTAAIVRYGCEELVQQRSLRRTVGARLFILGPLLCLLAAASWLWRVPLSQYLGVPSWAVLWVDIAVAGSIASVTVQSLLQASSAMKGYAWLLLIERAGVLAGLLSLQAVRGVEPVLGCMMLVAVMPWLSTLAGLRFLAWRAWWPPVADLSWVRRHLRFSLPLILAATAATVATWADVALTNHFVSTLELGAYALARQMAMLLKQGVVLAGFLVSPILFQWHVSGEPARIDRYVQRLLPLAALLWCSVVAILLPLVWWVLPHIWGAEFARADWPWLLLAVELGLSAWYYLGVPVLTAHEASGRITLINTLTAILVPALGWWLIPRHGIVGSAWAVVCTSWAGQVLVLYSLRRLSHLRWAACAGAMLPLLLSAGLCWWAGPWTAVLGTAVLLLILGRWLWRRRAFLDDDDLTLLRTIELPAWSQWALDGVRWVLSQAVRPPTVATASQRSTTPTVSVIIPTFNRAELVVRAVESVLAQTWPEYEVIVVDDGSTDDTADRLRPYAGRMTLLRQPHAERATARNRGIAASRGAFIAFLDSDDRWLPAKLADDLAVFARSPEAGLVYCGAALIDAAERPLKRLRTPWREGQVVEPLVWQTNFIPNSSVTVRRACLEAVGGFREDPQLSGSEDWELWFRLAARFPVAAVRRHNIQLRVHQQNTLHNAAQMERSMWWAWTLIQRHPALAQQSPARIRRAEAVVARHIAVGYYGSRQMAAARTWLHRSRRLDGAQVATWRWLTTYFKSWLPRRRAAAPEPSLAADLRRRIGAIVEQAVAELPDLEVWKNQFRFRAREFELLARQAPMPRSRRVLEVGCGNGLSATLLAQSADLVIATDLPQGNPHTASQGIGSPQRLFDTLGVTNCHPLACPGEALPFADGSFDLVFSSHTLEHIPQPASALQEMHRVLAPGGWLYLVLPTTVERMTFLPSFYQQLWGRAWARAWRHHAPADAAPPASSGSNGRITWWELLWQRHPHFPWPEPHGAYRHFLAEVVAYHPWRWRRLVERNGFQIRQQFTTILFPYHLAGLLTDPFPWFLRWSDWVRPLHGWPVLRSLGHNVCLVAQKE
ncbi:MAG: glycosyltransferase [Candidatus Omnitrophica bacterium]|nr:glycosyltransferase [Candidatus Omnitrophota bacterium]